ncbi:hypothetical protein BVRB_8g193990 [Beta vulgaris subsp. vulgaris]|nr:hypothetical protein BVRB_8g193990 [Beta vulgaris subsp. vulgaris]
MKGIDHCLSRLDALSVAIELPTQSYRFLLSSLVFLPPSPSSSIHIENWEQNLEILNIAPHQWVGALEVRRQQSSGSCAKLEVFKRRFQRQL